MQQTRSTIYDVYGMGNALVDVIANVDESFFDEMGICKGVMTLIDRPTHDTIMARLVIETREGGGSAANAMIALARFGGSGFYSCKVAGDEAGRFYVEELHRAGLATNLDPSRLGDGLTGKCIVMITPDADRTMNTYLGATETFSHGELDEGALARSRYLYVEGYLVAQRTGQPAAVEAMRVARTHGVKRALTFSDPTMITLFRKGMNEIVGDGLDLILCNEDEARAFAETTDLAVACERMKGAAAAFAVTRGCDGVVVYDGRELVEVPAQRVSAVDTVGAGDMFAGAFLYAITHGRSYTTAARLACDAAARVVTKYGPRLARDEIEDILRAFEQNNKTPACR